MSTAQLIEDCLQLITLTVHLCVYYTMGVMQRIARVHLRQLYTVQ